MQTLEYVEIDADYCANTYGVARCKASKNADAAAATAFNPTLNNNASGQGGITRRQLISAAAFSAVSGNRIRLTLAPPTGGGTETALQACWIGRRGTLPHDFDGTQVQVTFGGVSAIVMTAGGGNHVSDDIPFSFNPADDLVLAFDIIATSSLRYISGLANVNAYYKVGDSANVGASTVTGYTDAGAQLVCVELIEVLNVNTGEDKCFNTKKTCQDTDNFLNSPVTRRFRKQASFYPADIEAIPSIKSINFEPAILSLGENLGQRSTLTITFEDHSHPDSMAGDDKYFAERSYDPKEQGSFWGKWRARNPYLRGRALRWICGKVGDEYADMVAHHFVIDSFTGPTVDGEYKLVAKDILKLADGDRAQAPIANTGRLSSGISAVDTSATLLPTGVGDLEYESGGFIAIAGREICAFSRTGDALTLTRGSGATAHSANDRCQQVLVYSGLDPASIIADLLVNYAGVDIDYIDGPAWAFEIDTFLNRLYTGVIPNPTSVNTLISEVIQQAGLAVWWDEVAQLIRLQVLRGIDTSAAEFNEQNVMAEPRLSITEQPDKRLSQVHVYFAQKNPLTSLTDKSNFASNAKLGDDESEDDYGSPAIKEIFSRWIPTGGRTTAERCAELHLSRFRDPPRRFTFEVFPETIDADVEMGAGFRLKSRAIQAANGDEATAQIELTRVNPRTDSATVAIEAEEMNFTSTFNPDEPPQVVFDSNALNVDVRAAYDLLYPTPESGDDVYITVMTGVRIGSTSNGDPAFNIGSWPAGVNLFLVNNGTIQGAGGAAGAAGSTGNNGAGGQQGGAAILTVVPINITNNGNIWGGGGGGGGGGGALDTSGPFFAGGGGGGGGRGKNPGAGGPGGGGTFSQGANGGAATEDAAGDGGDAGSHGGGVVRGGRGGDGGNNGDAGRDGDDAYLDPIISGSAGTGGTGGSPGAAINGISHVTYSGAGSILGPQIN